MKWLLGLTLVLVPVIAGAYFDALGTISITDVWIFILPIQAVGLWLAVRN